MPKKINVILIEDSEIDAEFVVRALKKGDLDFELTLVRTLIELESQLKEHSFDVIISDYNLISFTGEDVFEIVCELSPDTPFIVQSGTINAQMEVGLLQKNVTDVVLKSNVARLPFAVKRALQEKRDRVKLKRNLSIQTGLAEISMLLKTTITSQKAEIRMSGYAKVPT